MTKEGWKWKYQLGTTYTHSSRYLLYLTIWWDSLLSITIWLDSLQTITTWLDTTHHYDVLRGVIKMTIFVAKNLIIIKFLKLKMFCIFLKSIKICSAKLNGSFLKISEIIMPQIEEHRKTMSLWFCLWEWHYKKRHIVLILHISIS